MARASWLSWLPLAALAGCPAPGYSPYPLDRDQDLPADAFARCRDVLSVVAVALECMASALCRGASLAVPLLGTPQGLSVFLDGVRVNEAFGDVVHWDLIPNTAIANMALVPGSQGASGDRFR